MAATTASLLDRVRSFPDFAQMPIEAGADLVESGLVRSVTPDEILATQGSYPQFFPLVLSGQARIYAMDEDGREFTLYRVHPGDGCVLAAACSVSGEPLPGFVVIESAGEALLIPADALRAWVDRHRFWRDYVFSLVARQLGQVVAVTNALAFQRLDVRIAGYLLRGANGPDSSIRATHHAVAMEVGTRREVASRILKELEQAGLVSLGRGVIHVRDRQALARRAEQSAPFPASVT